MMEQDSSLEAHCNTTHNQDSLKKRGDGRIWGARVEQFKCASFQRKCILQFLYNSEHLKC